MASSSADRHSTVTVILVPGRQLALLDDVVEGALNQTFHDLELLVLQPGSEEMKAVSSIPRTRTDRRIRVLETRTAHPLHEAVRASRGDILCYLTEEVLWIENHVETLVRLLQQADLAHTQGIKALPGGRLKSCPVEFTALVGAESLRASARWLPLGAWGHTRKCYEQLPQGWRGFADPSDPGFWVQALSSPTLQLAFSREPSMLFFPAEHRSGWTETYLREERLMWRQRASGPDAQARMRTRLMETLFSDHVSRFLREVAAHGDAGKEGRIRELEETIERMHLDYRILEADHRILERERRELSERIAKSGVTSRTPGHRSGGI